MAGHRSAAPNPPGAHYLRDQALIHQLVRASRVGPGQLVLDFGAGHGAVTTALAASGARRVTAQSFTPPPRVAAAHLSIRPRPLAASPSGQRLLRRLLPVAFRNPQLPARQLGAEGTASRRRLVSHAAVRDALTRAVVDPQARAAGLTAGQWHDLIMRLAEVG